MINSSKHSNCSICGTEITALNRMANRVIESADGEAHSFCRVIVAGMVPECPLYEGIEPRPCSNDCLQAQACQSDQECSCKCENMNCSVGQAVHALRLKGVVQWNGYLPGKLRAEVYRSAAEKATGAFAGLSDRAVSDMRRNVNWKLVYEYLCKLSSHRVYLPH